MKHRRRHLRRGHPTCPYCGGDLVTTKATHPVGLFLLVAGLAGAVYATYAYRAAGLVAYLFPWFWLLWKKETTECDDCGIKV